MENTSGLVPVDLRILVKPDAVEEVTRGGVHLPGTHVDKAKYAATKATFIAAGENAFTEWGSAARKPQPGDRVLFAQYSGAREKGADGQDYVVMNDKDLLAVIEEGVFVAVGEPWNGFQGGKYMTPSDAEEHRKNKEASR